MTIFEKLLEGFFGFLVKILSKLPASSFEFSDGVGVLSDYLGYLNFFVPFYRFSEMFTAFTVVFDVVVTVLIIYRVTVLKTFDSL